MAAKTKWDYSFSNLGPRKRTGGITFYKVKLGSEEKWLSMEGIRMLEKAKAAGVKFKTVRKAATWFTETGTRHRLKILRTNIKRDLDELMSGGAEGFDIEGKPSGLITMLERAGLKDLADDFEGLLSQMTEAQLREFYTKNKLLLQKYFADSDVYTTAGTSDRERYGNDKDAELSATKDNVRRNALKLRDKMMRILTRDMSASEIAKIEDVNVRMLLIKYSREHL